MATNKEILHLAHHRSKKRIRDLGEVFTPDDGVILRDVIQGLEYLHSLGYVHRLDQNPLQKDPFPPDLAHLIMCVFSSMAELFIV